MVWLFLFGAWCCSRRQSRISCLAPIDTSHRRSLRSTRGASIGFSTSGCGRLSRASNRALCARLPRQESGAEPRSEREPMLQPAMREARQPEHGERGVAKLVGRAGGCSRSSRGCVQEVRFACETRQGAGRTNPMNCMVGSGGALTRRAMDWPIDPAPMTTLTWLMVTSLREPQAWP